jgi:hypothetical protein
LLLHPGWFAAAGAVAIAFGVWQLLGGRDPMAALPPVSSAPPVESEAAPAPPAIEPAPASFEPAPEPEAASFAPEPAPASFAPEPAPVPTDASATPDVSARPPAIDALLASIDAPDAEAAAARALLASWTLEPREPVADLTGLLRELESNGLRVRRLEGDLDRLRALNLPAVVRLVGPDGVARPAVLRHLDAGTASLIGLGDATLVSLPEDELAARLTGDAWVAWRDFVSLPPVLRDGHAGTSVYWLQTTLAELGFYRARPSGRFDDPTASAVRAFQQSRGLEPDGQVGPNTKIGLYDALGDYRFPRLAAAGARG